MRLKHVAVLGGIVGALGVGVAGPALATESMTVTPDKAYRGQSVHIRVHGCPNPTEQAESTAFESPAHLTLSNGVLEGDAMISKWAQMGMHKVKVYCEQPYKQGRTYEATVTVIPKGGAHTGIGGSGGGTNQALAGAGAVLMLGAGGMIIARRRYGDARS